MTRLHMIDTLQAGAAYYRIAHTYFTESNIREEEQSIITTTRTMISITSDAFNNLPWEDGSS